MRIVHITDCYAPRLGGIEVQVAELARMQLFTGHTPHVVTATPGHGEPDPESPALPPVHRVVAPLPFELPVHPRPGRRLERLFAELQPDVVHAHVGAVSSFAWSAARCAARSGLPLVVSVHSMWDAVTRTTYRALAETYAWTRWPIVLAPVSRAAAARVLQVCGDRVPVEVVPNGLDLTGWRQAAPRPEPAPTATGAGVHVVAVGRLAPRKRALPLLRVLRRAARQIGAEAGLRATIVGDGPAEPFMRQYLSRHRMTDWVELPGRVDRELLPAVLASADLFLAPAAREAFGLAALEARAAGVPVVARRDTGVADFVVHGHNGILADDDRGLADGIVRLAVDRDLRHRIAGNNRAESPDASSWPAVLGLLEGCYARACCAAESHRPMRSRDGPGLPR
ncbi:glycosyltransferase family 4 protein [Pseudonocardia sp. K10HN5]|uniref:Glycosyltransferase family 4 protein n=1 Tax=Pseudonocardia acidicola TaxID=2724939 RepID=A0ABX1S8J7_9PSEU|nr:glycosyltransferase family 4 protein [Pseudonocardia acidicola]NMH97883.1 glycosyltransferase family 4 protein [Pseudonocardia acidicola]